jgi:hypothetical protein
MSEKCQMQKFCCAGLTILANGASRSRGFAIQGCLGYTRRVGIGSRGPAGCFSRPGEEHRAGSGYVRDKNVQPRMAEFLIHEQQREPKLAAGVVDTSRAAARVSEVCQLGVAKATHEVTLVALKGDKILLCGGAAHRNFARRKIARRGGRGAQIKALFFVAF